MQIDDGNPYRYFLTVSVTAPFEAPSFTFYLAAAGRTKIAHVDNPSLWSKIDLMNPDVKLQLCASNTGSTASFSQTEIVYLLISDASFYRDRWSLRYNIRGI